MNVVDKAIGTSLARPSAPPVLIPKDIQDRPESKGARSSARIAGQIGGLFAAADPVPPERLLPQAADLIDEGKKVAMLIDRGCISARQEIFELVELASAPVAKALTGNKVIRTAVATNGSHRPAGRFSLPACVP